MSAITKRQKELNLNYLIIYFGRLWVINFARWAKMKCIKESSLLA